ncbi:putative ATP-grasp-modified RiPP [Streptomyces wuyuanensis]|uniref:putative ATP-grasp-modified RiPP n=1 Tax=Streptomyces wuyuanensis TaxID=1196353 RepID=UPI003716D5C4
MFVHSDRLPTSTPVPQGAATPAPWGVSRMAPYPTMAPGYSHARLDPTTQTAVFLDTAGSSYRSSSGLWERFGGVFHVG